jgi:thiol-disulfide isomerase/thioredoxin
MKKLSALLVTAVLILAGGACAKKPAGAGSEGALSFDPAKPRPGRAIAFTYDPAGTPLRDASGVRCTAYLYAKDAPAAESVALTRKDSRWTGTLEPGAAVRGVILKFEAEGLVDNNEKKGYTLTLFDDDGDPVPGSLAGLAEAYATWGKDLAGMNTDQDLALALLDKEFALHPEVKKDYLSPYFSLLARLKKDEGRALILAELEAVAARPDPDADALSLLYYWMGRLNKPEEAARYAALLREKDPGGEFVQAERFQEFLKAPDAARKTELLARFKADFPGSPLVPQFVRAQVAALRERRDFATAADYVLGNPEGVPWNLYATLSSDFLRNKLDAGKAARLAARALELARAEDAAGAKPSYLTAEEWAKEKDSVLGQALATEGEALLAVNKGAEALQAFKEAVRRTAGGNAALNTRYAELLVRVPGTEPAAALAEMEPFIASGNGTAALREHLRTAYRAREGSDAGFDGYLAGLEERARARLDAELRQQMIDFPAADFELEDLDGNRVSLQALRGKIVVLDFWATWCAPCLSAFPAMRKAVERHKDDAGVRFYFVNAWERAEDKAKNARDFLSKTGYPFTVLLDLENRVIDAFKVDGIPTKFVIDGRGRIRFKTTGYSGNHDRLLAELDAMIEMVR